MGSNVVAPLKKSTSHGMSVGWKEINLSETKGGYVMITTSTNDLSELINRQSIILVDRMKGCEPLVRELGRSKVRKMRYRPC